MTNLEAAYTAKYRSDPKLAVGLLTGSFCLPHPLFSIETLSAMADEAAWEYRGLNTVRADQYRAANTVMAELWGTEERETRRSNWTNGPGWDDRPHR